MKFYPSARRFGQCVRYLTRLRRSCPVAAVVLPTVFLPTTPAGLNPSQGHHPIATHRLSVSRPIDITCPTELHPGATATFTIRTQGDAVNCQITSTPVGIVAGSVTLQDGVTTVTLPVNSTAPQGSASVHFHTSDGIDISKPVTVVP